MEADCRKKKKEQDGNCNFMAYMAIRKLNASRKRKVKVEKDLEN